MNKYVIFPGNNGRFLLKPLLDRRGNWTESESNDLKASFIWSPVLLSIKDYATLDSLYIKSTSPMIHNHLENNREITTKTGLIRSLRLFYSTHDPAVQASYQVHDSIATSFIITANYEDMEYQLFLNRFNEISNMHSNKERTPAKHCSKNMWLIKPAALNQGKGIEVCRTLKEIQKSFRAKPINSLWIIQKYIEKPLLFKGRKFDIRMWAVATGKHELFYYKHGYLRTSSSEYDTQGTDNFIHLTNNCLQKFGDNYGAYEKGNTLSFADFQEYLNTEFPYGLSFEKDILPRTKDLMIDCYLSAKKTIHKSKRRSVFEFLGFDFLIDEDFRVWLIEVNTNPYLGVPNEYIESLLPEMLDDLLEITVDNYIPPRFPKARQENNFELLYSDHGSAFAKDGVNQRQSYLVPMYPVAELQQIPLSKQSIVNKSDEEQPKPIVKDLLTTVKHIIEFSQEPVEFNEVTSRVISQINNWELLSEEQLMNSLQALKIISGSSGSSALIEGNSLNVLLSMISSENVERAIQLSIVDAIIVGFQNMRLRKEIVKKGLIHILINIIFNCGNEALQDAALKALVTLCTSPTKGVYVPGKSREHIWVKERLINEGGILCILKAINFNISDAKLKKYEEIEKMLFSEFNLTDWEAQIALISKSQTNQHVFPIVLDTESIGFIKEKLEEIVAVRQREIKNRNEREKAKKEEEDEEKRKKSLIIQQEIEEKKRRAEEYIQRRYEEIRREKLNELKKQNKFGRTAEDKFLEEKRHALLIKLKKAEELRALQEIKLRHQEQQIKKNEVTKKKKQSEKRKHFLHDFTQLKMDLDRTKNSKKPEDREKEELDKIFHTIFYSKRGCDKLDITDDSFNAIPAAPKSKIDSTKYADSLVHPQEKKLSARKFSPMISRQNLFKIYGGTFSNSRLGTPKKIGSAFSVA